MIRSELRRNVQAFTDGLCAVYKVEDVSKPKEQPKERIVRIGSLRYDERTVGIARYDAGMARDVEITRILRVPRVFEVSTQNIVIPNDKKQYRIYQIQYPEGPVPDCMDLSLVKVEKVYEKEA